MAVRVSRASAEPLYNSAAALADLSRELAEALERQQLESPLADLAAELRTPTESSPILAACLDEDAAPHVARLLGLNPPALSAGSGAGADRVQEIRVAWSLEELADIRSFQQFCAAGRMLVLVTAADQEPASERTATALALIEAFDLVVVLCFAPASISSVAARLNRPSLNSLLILDGGVPAGTSARNLLLSPGSAWMQLTALMQNVRRQRAVVEEICRRRNYELTRANRRLELDSARAQGLGSRRTLKSESRVTGAIKESLEQSLAGTIRELEEKCELSLQPLGPLSGLMKQLTGELKVTDLEKQILPKTVRQVLGPQQLMTINQRVSEGLRQRLDADLTFVDASLQSAVSEAESQLRPLLGAGFSLRFKLPQHEQQWRAVQNLVSVGRETYIDLPRHSVFELITAGRQKVFMLTMFVMLATKIGVKQEDLAHWFGKTATDWISRSWAVVLVGVFVTSIITAIRTWRHDKDEQEHREMDKIRESLYGDGLKVLERVQNSRVSTLVAAIKDQSKAWQREIDTAVKNWAEQTEAQAEQELRRLEGGRRNLENQRKALVDLEKPCLKLEQSVAEQERSVGAFVGEARASLQQHWEALRPDVGAAAQKPDPEDSRSPADASAAPGEAVGPKPSAASRLAERRARRAQQKDADEPG